MKFQDYSTTTTIVTTLADVYGLAFATNPVAPKGYEFTGEFRSPELTDMWVARADYGMMKGYKFTEPRLILREYRKRRVITFTEIPGQMVPKMGQWYLSRNSESLYRATMDWTEYPNPSNVTVFDRTETEL